MPDSTILTDLDEGVFTITLNRPEKLNAYNQQMLEDVIDAMDRADADDDVRAVIITGAGRGFCAGADLSDGVATFDYAGGGQHVPKGESPVRPDGSIDFSHPNAQDGGGKLACRIFDSLKPVIAAVNGAAYGVGATMTLACDFRLMSENAKYGFPFTRIGLVPEGSSTWFLPRLVGISRALEWCLGARTVEAPEALAAGLVRSVHEPDELLIAAREFARSLVADTAPVSVALTRQMMWRMLGTDHPIEANKLDTRAIWSRGTTPDAAEGVTALLERRHPKFECKVSDGLPLLSPWLDKRDYE